MFDSTVPGLVCSQFGPMSEEELTQGLDQAFNAWLFTGRHAIEKGTSTGGRDWGFRLRAARSGGAVRHPADGIMGPLCGP